ncbi:dUTP diphosphatase [Synechococcus sp. PCC 7336]|uniref:dUTP diphosphatase n=1 Tax=Synechococcus sp. PCC 7336 TaxID=195250 RepID=UPI00034B4E52|nr:dUTP diphosphatase [Synechococcus sp. PCC 7336]
MLSVKIQRLNTCYALPSRRDRQDAGWDCYAAGDSLLLPRTIGKVSLGFSLEIPPQWAVMLLPRSGLASRGITLSNSPGLIDASYRGPVCALVSNLSDEPFTIRRGDRICQLVFLPVPEVHWQQAEELSVTARGAGGFGSTGV